MFLYLAFLFSLTATAQLIPNVVTSNASTLPKSRFLVGYNYYYSNLASEFGNTSNYSLFQENHQLVLETKSIIQGDALRGRALQGLMNAYGVSESDTLGQYAISLDGRSEANIYTIGYGLSDRVGIYVVLPVVSIDMRSQLKWTASNSMNQFIGSLEKDRQIQAVNDLQAGVEKGFEKALIDKGYDLDSLNLKRKSVGDLRLQSKFILDASSIVNISNSKWSLDPFVVLPTAKSFEDSDLIPIQAGEKRFAIGLASNLQIRTGYFLSGLSTELSYPLNSMQKTRKAVGTNSVLNDQFFEVDRNTEISNGLQFNIHWDETFLVLESFRLMSALDYRRHLRNNYRGNVFAENDYRLMSDQSNRELTSLVFGFGLNTIQWFLAKDFPIPLDFAFNATWPISGRNTLADTSYQAQIFFFF